MKLENLPLVQQQLAGAPGVFVEDVALFIGGDMHPVEEHLTVLDDAEGVLQVHIPLADGLDLGAGKLNTGFVFLFDEIVVKSLAVGGQLLDGLLCHPGHLLSVRGNSIPRIPMLRKGKRAKNPE